MDRKLIEIDLSPNALAERKLINNLLEINSTTQRHGLIVTEIIAKEIIEARRLALKDNDRVDFSLDTTSRLIKAFSESYYITQENFSETIGEIIELFYFLKNEINDMITDDDMISEMLIVFNETCFGEIELMQSKGVEKIIRKYRFRDTEIWDDYEIDNPDRYWVSPDNERLEDRLEYGETWRE